MNAPSGVLRPASCPAPGDAQGGIGNGLPHPMQQDGGVEAASLPLPPRAGLGSDGSRAAAHEVAHEADELRSLRRALLVPVLATATAVGAWCHWAPLSGAIIGTGRVQAEYGRKTVQHLEGGIVQAVLVRPGQAVRRGDALLLMADVQNDATLQLLQRQRDAEQLRAARAQAELAGAAAVAWPGVASPGDEARSREQDLFNAGRRSLLDQEAALQLQLDQAGARHGATAALVEAAAQSLRLAQAELELNRRLADDGFIQPVRLLGLERNAADLSARAAAAQAQLADTLAQRAALQRSQAELRGSYRQRAADELRDATARLRELHERLRPVADLSQRRTVRAPVDGLVMALRLPAPGTAVGPREPLLELSPTGENLLVEVPIDPHDIDHVRAGGPAEVRLTAFDTRRHPPLPAVVRQVSPDAGPDAATQRPVYVAQVEVAAGELARHPGLHLQPGMPAEVFITTPERTLLDYVLEPLSAFARRALREP